MSDKTFKEAKEAHLKLESQLQAAQQIINTKLGKRVKPKKQKPQQKVKNLDPLILKLIKEGYNQRLENILKMQEALQATFQQHPIVLEFQRKDQVAIKYQKLLETFEKSKEQLNQFHLEARKEYIAWLNLIKEEEDV